MTRDVWEDRLGNHRAEKKSCFADKTSQYGYKGKKQKGKMVIVTLFERPFPRETKGRERRVDYYWVIPSHLQLGFRTHPPRTSMWLFYSTSMITPSLNMALHKVVGPFCDITKVSKKGITLSCGPSITGKTCLLSSQRCTASWTQQMNRPTRNFLMSFIEARIAKHLYVWYIVQQAFWSRTPPSFLWLVHATQLICWEAQKCTVNMNWYCIFRYPDLLCLVLALLYTLLPIVVCAPVLQLYNGL